MLLFLLCLRTSPALVAQQSAGVPPFPQDLVSFKSVRLEPVFAGAGEGHWDAKIRERGWVLKENNQFRMWYTGYDGTRHGIKRLGYATSKDGLTWSRRALPLIDDVWLEDMMVLRQGGRYLMVAEGRGDQAQLLSSEDGLQWKQHGALDVRLMNGDRIPPGPYGTPTLYYEDGVFNLFYERRDAGVWLAKSRDLKVWTNVSDEPVLKLGATGYDRVMIAMNQIVKRGDWYYGYYHGTSSATKPRKWCVCVAASKDLVHWTKFDKNPLQPVEQNKSSGIVVKDGATLKFFTMHDRVEMHEPVAWKRSSNQ